ncbi:MAG: 23S rRNA (adenine(2503)-C(2))-methyltransferase RlmN, partial [Acutalibacteraceae bacterium]|nr:23S rRNA (adenine(2503)-C(2))-methyltransferase RlmN [Acutalibacteraceae bacterium]
MDKKDIKSMTLCELEDALKELSLPKFRAKQIYSWLRKGVQSFDEMSNLPKNLRETLCNIFSIYGVKIKKRLESRVDDTVKYLYELYDGECIESVVMKYKHGYTVCISSQVGCRMGCSFCASGIEGLFRNLSASEMLAQVEMAG